MLKILGKLFAFVKILHRQLFGELVITFLAALFVITFFMSMLSLLRYVHRGLMINHVFDIVGYIIPSVLVMTIPISILTAATLVYGRMSSDNEINLLRTSGVHINFIILPVLVVASALSLCNYYLNHNVIPNAKDRRERAMFVSTQAKIDLLKQLGLQHLRFPNMTIIFDRIDDNNILHKLMIFSFDRDTKRLKEIVAARKGEINFDDEKDRGIFHLSDCDVIGMPEKTDARPLDRFSLVHMAKLIDQDRPTITSDITDMVSGELVKKEPEFRKLTQDIYEKYPGVSPDKYPRADRKLFYRWYELQTELAKRNAMAFTPIVFVLIGTPLGILIRRQNKLVAFFVACLPVLLIYYPLYMVCSHLGIYSQFKPHIALWLPNLTLGGTGGFLLWKLYRQ